MVNREAWEAKRARRRHRMSNGPTRRTCHHNDAASSREKGSYAVQSIPKSVLLRTSIGKPSVALAHISFDWMERVCPVEGFESCGKSQLLNDKIDTKL
jgi:hypothetical protein